MYQSIYGNKCSRDSDGRGITYTQITLREITFCPGRFETDPHKCHFTDTSCTSSSRGWKTDPEKHVPERHTCAVRSCLLTRTLFLCRRLLGLKMWKLNPQSCVVPTAGLVSLPGFRLLSPASRIPAPPTCGCHPSPDSCSSPVPAPHCTTYALRSLTPA